MSIASTKKQPDVILGNSNKRFSGVTSTMLQNAEHQKDLVCLRILGKHHLDRNLKDLHISFFELCRLLKRRKRIDGYCVFHARRNDEMLQALLLRIFFRNKLRILFTSTAQRQHSKFTHWLMAKMDRVISTCNAAASYLPTPPDDIVPHGVQSNLYKPCESKRPKRTTIAMFGRVRPQKGSHIFVDACLKVLPNHPDVDAVIVGEITPKYADYVDQLQIKISQSGLKDRIKFSGKQSFAKIPELFQTASLVAALSENEGFGLTVLEALSSGAAVLASKAGAWQDIITDGEQGYIVPTNDIDATTAKLNELLQDRDKLKLMGQNGRDLIERSYRIEIEAKKLCDIYKLMR